MKNLCLLILSLSLCSCYIFTGEFTIKNQSGFDLDSLYIMVYGSEDIKQDVIHLKNNSTTNYTIIMPSRHYDGDYRLRAFSEGKLIYFENFGYFSNGSFQESEYTLILQPDTMIEVKEYNFW